MQRNQKVQRIPKRYNINIGVILFVIIVIYIGINVYLYITKPKMAIYEVSNQSIAQNDEVTGIITREEKVVKASQSGYIHYYCREGTKTAKNSVIYSVNKDPFVSNQTSDTNEESKLSKENIADIKRTIVKYKNRMEQSGFHQVYSFYDDISSVFTLAADNMLYDNLSTDSDKKNPSGILLGKAKEPGIVTYTSDNYDELKTTGITTGIFDQSKYLKTELRTSEIIEKSAPVYKIITDDRWKITAPLTKEQAALLSERKTIQFVINMDKKEVTAPIRVYEEQNNWFLEISMDRFVSIYCKERFLDLTLQLKNESGLKIPTTAVIEKDFYVVPKEYLTKGGDSNKTGVMLEVYDEKTGKVTPKFKALTVFYQDEENAYIDQSILKENDYICNIKTNDRMPISMTVKLKGVYNVNKGYAVFKQIEVIDENEEYIVVRDDTKNGIAVYDHIALNADLVIESSVIY